MIKYENFVIMIKEGLILTQELSKCKNIIEREAGNLNHWFNIDFNFDLNTFVVNFDKILNNNELEYLFHVYNNLGFYLGYYKVNNFIGMTKVFPWKDYETYKKATKNKKNILLFFESKFDQKLKYNPNKLYHVTNIERISKIKRNGLMPLYFKKSDYRPDRIYFALNLNDAENIKTKNITNDTLNNRNNQYIIYEVDTKNIYDLVLYKDPRSNGVYTYNHINPKFLKIC